jgi:vancomycin resistance protein YoaR
VASTGGRRIDVAALGRDLLAVLPRRDGRQVTGQLRTVEPTAATAEMSRLGIRERVSTFTTTFSGGRASPRSRNIYRIADEVDGAVVKPGKVFSLNGHTGKRGVAQGYREAPIIVGGRLVPGVGGGASQFTTTLFNAAYYAGLEDVEHKPHSFWFSRYPAVIESTIFYPTLDLKFRNNTPHALLIDTSHTADSVTVSIWSTRVYDRVSTTYGPRRNVTRPRTVRLPAGPSCIPTDGIRGFSQSAWRVIRKGGKVVKREKFSWRYAPEPRYLCGR